MLSKACVVWMVALVLLKRLLQGWQRAGRAASAAVALVARGVSGGCGARQKGPERYAGGLFGGVRA